jgi:LacI family transcriptional regulator
MRSACHHIMHYHKLLPASSVATSSSVVVVTPENIPDYIASRFRD